MKDDFSTLIDLFSLESEDKEQRIDEIFHLTMSFIEKYKYIQNKGDETEKKSINEKMALLKEKISYEKKLSQEQLSLTPEEINALSLDESNFTKEQWEMLQTAKSSAKRDKEKLSSKKTEDPLKTTKGRIKRKRSKRGQSPWLKS